MFTTVLQERPCIYVFIITWKKVFYKDIYTLIWADGTSHPTYPLCYIEKFSSHATVYSSAMDT